ncbi:GIY-YIG nuclease family protein [Bacillus paranthracis]
MRDSSGKIVYIGEALYLRKRLTEHMAGKKWYYKEVLSCVSFY